MPFTSCLSGVAVHSSQTFSAPPATAVPVRHVLLPRDKKTSTMMSKPNHLYLHIPLVEITTWNKDPVFTCYLLEHMGSYK